MLADLMSGLCRSVVRLPLVVLPALVVSALGSTRPHLPVKHPDQPAATKVASALAWGGGFEANVGQTNAGEPFLTRTPAGPMVFSPTGARWTRRSRDGRISAVRAEWIGARAGATAAGLQPRPERITYFGWAKQPLHTRAYDRIRFSRVYPGIDLEYYRSQGELEHDWIVAPGADPGRIRMRFEGADSVRLDGEGHLHLGSGAGETRQRRPVVYQEDAGRREPVAGEYRDLGNGEFGFRLAEYDRTRPLIIDPVLEFSTYLGGTGHDFADDLTVDAAGRSYFSGYTLSLDFPGKAVQGPIPSSGLDFVASLSADMRQLDYVVYFQRIFLGAIEATPDGRVVAAGSTSLPDFPATPGAFQSTLAGEADAFVLRLSPDGAELEFATLFGGANDDVAQAVAISVSGDITLAGATRSRDLPLLNPAQPQLTEDERGVDGFVMRLSSNGDLLKYSTYLGAGGRDEVHRILLAEDDTAYVVRSLTIVDTSSLEYARFIHRFSPQGEELAAVAAAEVAGTTLKDVALDVDGTVLALTGKYDFTDAPPRSAINRNRGKWELVRLDRNLEKVIDRYPFVLGMRIYQLLAGPDRSVYLMGLASSDVLQPVRPIQPNPEEPFLGIGLARVDPRARRILFSTFLGGAAQSSPSEMHGMPDGSVLCFGDSNTTDFPVLRPVQGGLNLPPGTNDPADFPGDLLILKIRDETPGEPLPKLSLSSRELRFRASLRPEGPTAPGRLSSVPTQTLWLGNGGSAPLTLTVSGPFGLDGRVDGPFEVISGGGTTVIPPRGRAKVVVRFSPSRSGPHRGVLVLASTDPTRGVYRMPLLGTATR